MKILDALIPPPIVTATAIACIWLANRTGWGHVTWQMPHWLVGVLIGFALLLMLLAVIEMFRQHTTVNPLTPNRSSALVTSGIFKFSRNPIYLGDALLVVAAGFFFSNLVFIPALAAFIAYINRFQIIPEERALQSKFGRAFDNYLGQTRRWF
jgi:protein-S-isoprenylcysteine O-methyltransferase Ste14